MKTLRLACRAWVVAAVVLCVGGVSLKAQQSFSVAGHVELRGASAGAGPTQSPMVVWLEPSGETRSRVRPWRQAGDPPRLTQKNKQFEPHLLVVPVGGVVVFPNRDPFFHNVFSLFEGQRFDLGLYEAGTAREVHFDKPGVSYIFCNIHSEMSAVVIALDTPYYGIAEHDGNVTIPNVPAGAFAVKVWAERAPTAQLNPPRMISVSQDSRSLGSIRLTAAPVILSHKNKYGVDYDPPSPSNPAYPQP